MDKEAFKKAVELNSQIKGLESDIDQIEQYGCHLDFWGEVIGKDRLPREMKLFFDSSITHSILQKYGDVVLTELKAELVKLNKQIESL